MKSLWITAAMALGTVLVGCESDSPTAKSQSDHVDWATAQAVTCDKCKVTWVKSPEHKGRIVSFTNRKSMVCPDCQGAVENFFSTGKFEHTCPTCGPNALDVCKIH